MRDTRSQIATTRKLEPNEQNLTLQVNHGQHYVGKHSPESLVKEEIDQLWQPSAYAGTTGELTTALMKFFLRE